MTNPKRLKAPPLPFEIWQSIKTSAIKEFEAWFKYKWEKYVRDTGDKSIHTKQKFKGCTEFVMHELKINNEYAYKCYWKRYDPDRIDKFLKVLIINSSDKFYLKYNINFIKSGKYYYAG